MLTLREHLEVNEAINLMEGEQPEFTDEQLDKAEYYELKWHPVSANTILSLFDEAGEKLGEMEFEDADIAIAFVEEYFELEEDDIRDLESYAWANPENYDDRVIDTMQDDGTSDAE